METMFRQTVANIRDQLSKESRLAGFLLGACLITIGHATLVLMLSGII